MSRFRRSARRLGSADRWACGRPTPCVPARRSPGRCERGDVHGSEGVLSSVSALRPLENNGLSLQVRGRRPAGQCPRSRLSIMLPVTIVIRPPLLIDVGRFGQREAEQILNLGEREDDRVRESMLQILIEQLVLPSLHRAGRFLFHFDLVQPHTLRVAPMPPQRRTLLNKTPGLAWPLRASQVRISKPRSKNQTMSGLSNQGSDGFAQLHLLVWTQAQCRQSIPSRLLLKTLMGKGLRGSSQRFPGSKRHTHVVPHWRAAPERHNKSPCIQRLAFCIDRLASCIASEAVSAA
jgi:hypothetical protein